MNRQNKRNSLILSAFFIFTLIFVDSVNAYNFDFITVRDIVGKVKKRFSEIGSYQASFKIVSDKMGKKIHQSGIIKYKSSDKLLIEFHSPHGQKIVSNGDMMWVYIPSMNVVAEQNLESGSGLFSSGTKSGLNRLFSKYHYRFASKDQPQKNKSGNKYYTLLLKQRETRSGFRKIKLWVSEKYFITRAKGETSTGKKIDIKFSNIKTDLDFPNGIFKFDMPARARVIKNPMISEE